MISVDAIEDKISRNQSVQCVGLAGANKAYFAASLYVKLNRPLCIILPTPKDVEKFQNDFRFFSASHSIPFFNFPSYNISPYKNLSYHNETAARRVGILYHLMSAEKPFVMVTNATSLSQQVLPQKELIDYAELLMENEEFDRDALIQKLIAGGYVRTSLVEEPGDFSVRGGVLDLYSPLYPDPLRIEFFGDLVESLRTFSVVSQRTLENVREVVVIPARETILRKDSLDKVMARIREQAARQEIPITKMREVVDRIKKEGVFSGLERLIPLVYPKLNTIFDYIPDSALYILDDPARLDQEVANLIHQAQVHYQVACHDARLCAPPELLYISEKQIQEILSSKKTLNMKALPVESANASGASQYRYQLEDTTDLRMQMKHQTQSEHLYLPLAEWINQKKEAAYAVFLVCNTENQAHRLNELLGAYGLLLNHLDKFPELRSGVHRHQGIASICHGEVSGGFVWPTERIAVVPEQDIFGKTRRRRRSRSRNVRTELLSFEDLKIGDLVVHSDHGIGQYEGLVKLKLNGTTNDFLLILYKDLDKLYLPVDRMGSIQKYLGVDGVTPLLDKMGGKSWDRVKQKVKRSVEKIAGELLKLYAARKVREGHTFRSPDDSFHDFVNAFQFEETSDQMKAIEEVIEDMGNSRPMDRLVCGDVGYGKTEVALRAAFMAVSSGKQAAMLVPTTVLAQQHYDTFKDRFRNYPVQIACLSRFRSKSKQKAIIADLQTGKTDIVIGTHRLLQKDVGFKDLGLMVLDEEQRFGVKHKEILKQMRKTVDVLTLTATPIPRTLHLSLMGIRDISVIATPPEHRKSIITYVSEFDDAVIQEAIHRELNRSGQVFFVHNNIQSIWKMADHLKALVPQVRLGVAHGRLSEVALEKVMMKFLCRDIDMLLCTTIIESGLDIPAANTILINRADRFGLSQIYQLRGRVGRADEQAYAYLFIPQESTLTRDAQKRLKVLMEHSDLGSGFQIAMSDLKIRGGGTILGASQSGHIAAVGYDMFLKLMENCISEMKGEPVLEDIEPEINITLSAYLPEKYIADIDQRLAVYRRLARLTEVKEISAFKAELGDRFGKLPEAAENLLLKMMLKVLSAKAGVKRLDLNKTQLLLTFSEAHQKRPFGIIDMAMNDKSRYEFTPEQALKVRLKKGNFRSSLLQIKNILKEVAQRVNG
jgi:transcription-repair coupling factor (superfamily II helicase)